MKIISKQGKGFRDYYDHLQGELGQDELVVYDRRDAFPIDTAKRACSEFYNTNVEKWFKKEPIYSDTKRVSINRWSTKKIMEHRSQDSEAKDMGGKKMAKIRTFLEGQVYHFVLEVGYHHYYFEVERYLDDENETMVHLNYWLIESKRIEKDEKISDAPICLCPCEYRGHFIFSNDNEKFIINDSMKEQKINNPILFKTYIPKFISAYDMWNNIYEYISSLRDKEIIDTRTNEQHIESHGFDKKTSFRHRKK